MLGLMICIGYQTQARVGDFADLDKDEKLKVELEFLHPTQKGLGFIAVQEKYEGLKTMTDEDRKKYLKKHPVPVVVGPGGKALYLIDHHHLSLACSRLGIKKIKVVVIENQSEMTEVEFAAWMKDKNYVYLFDENDKEIEFSDLPDSILKMKNDVYRSLAGVVEDNGGFEKTGVPFMEFTWARFFRKYFTVDQINNSFDETLKAAIKVAHSRRAKDMPGFIGVASCMRQFQDF